VKKSIYNIVRFNCLVALLCYTIILSKNLFSIFTFEDKILMDIGAIFLIFLAYCFLWAFWFTHLGHASYAIHGLVIGSLAYASIKNPNFLLFLRYGLFYCSFSFFAYGLSNPKSLLSGLGDLFLRRRRYDTWDDDNDKKDDNEKEKVPSSATNPYVKKGDQ